MQRYQLERVFSCWKFVHKENTSQSKSKRIQNSSLPHESSRLQASSGSNLGVGQNSALSKKKSPMQKQPLDLELDPELEIQYNELVIEFRKVGFSSTSLKCLLLSSGAGNTGLWAIIKDRPILRSFTNFSQSLPDKCIRRFSGF